MTMDDKKSEWKISSCTEFGIPLMDTLELIHGKWKLIIIMALLYKGKMRFNELKHSINGISSRVLSKELKVMQDHQLITRTVKNTVPMTVEYELTAHGKTLESVALALVGWGKKHRHEIIHNAPQ